MSSNKSYSIKLFFLYCLFFVFTNQALSKNIYLPCRELFSFFHSLEGFNDFSNFKTGYDNGNYNFIVETKELKKIRNIIKNEGIFTVLYGKKSKGYLNDEFMSGTKVIYSSEYSRAASNFLKGVALHPGDYRKATDHVLGTINPHINSIQWEIDKWEEYLLFSKADQSSMPYTILAMDLFEQNRDLSEMRNFLSQIVRAGKLKNSEEKLLNEFLKKIFVKINLKFKNGAFLKLKDEYQTGDKGVTINTNEIKPGVLGAIFIKDYQKALKSLISIKTYLSKSSRRGTEIIYALLFKPESLLVQEALDFAKTDLGLPFELRVDVFHGIPLKAVFRHSNEFLHPEKINKSMVFVRNLMARLPAEYHEISGGFDVMFLVDGNIKLIESNAGSNSGFILGDFFPLQTNLFVSAIQGAPTAMIEYLTQIYLSPMERQINFFTHMDKYFNLSYDESFESQVFAWFRDNYINDFVKNPIPENGPLVLNRIHEIYKTKKDINEDFEIIYKSARLSIEKILKNKFRH